MAEEKLDPMQPDALCNAVKSGCFHCIVSVLAGREIAKGANTLTIAGNLLQIVAEIGNDVAENDQERATNRAAALDLLGRLFDGGDVGALRH